MKRLIQLSFTIISCSIMHLGCSTKDTVLPENEPYSQKIFLTEKAKAVVGANNTFGFGLLNKINDESEASDNIVISPLSASMALGMTMNGAAGDTRTAMENTLGFKDMTADDINESYKNLIGALTTVDPQVTIEIPNSIWYSHVFSVLQEFVNVNINYFNAEVNPLDFSDPASVDVINNWVAESTHDKIKTILDQIDEGARMFLINAVYFNGTWKFEFDEQYTEPETFYLADGTTKQVDMMKQEATLSYFSNEVFEAVDLFYGSGNFSMVVMLPKADYTPDDIISQMNDQNWNIWMNYFSEANIQLSMPKFKLEYEKRLNDALIGMGMAPAFDPYAADFSKINPDEPLFIGFVKQKTFIDVNEEGTEAAAVTIVGMFTTSTPAPELPYFFTVNKPFVFAIKERDTGAILFLGKVMEPLYED
ncbi:MAG: serpin family protein [Bacteroidetes bacterium]|nr:serpin family protein [Bacteroidota bacterium]